MSIEVELAERERMQAEWTRIALTVDCRRCRALPGEMCVNLVTGTTAALTHLTREDAGAALAKAQKRRWVP